MKTLAQTSSRLPLVEVPEDPLAQELFDKLAPGRGILNLHRMMAHAPALMKASGEMALALRRSTKLPRAIAELAILRIAQIFDCDYERVQHLPLARAAGVGEQQIKDLADWPHSIAFTPAEKTALGFAEKAALGALTDDDAFAALRLDFSPREIVELTMVVGFYVSTALFIKALAVADEKA